MCDLKYFTKFNMRKNGWWKKSDPELSGGSSLMSPIFPKDAETVTAGSLTAEKSYQGRLAFLKAAIPV
jgi:hypothetical protein